MLIDFHTHIFPPRIAPRAVASLKAGVKRETGGDSVNYTDATYDGLLRSMDENGVDISVVMPIVTNPEKPDGVNDYAKNVRNGRVVSFASVHPMQKDAPDAVKRIREYGFIGIKMHPEFQHCYIDSKESMAVLKAAEREGLYVTLHAGADIGMPPPVHCTPKRLKNALSELKGDRIIAAHLGGWRQWDDVEEYLVGTPIYMDTAFIADYIDPAQCARIIKTHGRILFGSDSPWEEPRYTLEFLMSLGLDGEIIEKIKHKNAEEILGR
ncbi:MAG: amidohydrolase family protein [Firmicutes bacterium]|nr:amidohydrolase family protein [Bacillota bacterium]